jgi:hypothetical protein
VALVLIFKRVKQLDHTPQGLQALQHLSLFLDGCACLFLSKSIPCLHGGGSLSEDSVPGKGFFTMSGQKPDTCTTRNSGRLGRQTTHRRIQHLGHCLDCHRGATACGSASDGEMGIFYLSSTAPNPPMVPHLGKCVPR